MVALQEDLSWIDHIPDLLARDFGADLPFSFRSGASEIIERARSVENQSTDLDYRLSTALEQIISAALAQTTPNVDSLNQTLMARACFIATELKIKINPFLVRSAALAVLASSFQSDEGANDFLLILRTLGRGQNQFEDALLWSAFMRHPNKGIRTLAAQNLIRADPKKAISELPRFVAAKVNESLVIHTLLRAIGGRKAFIDAVRSEPEIIPALQSALRRVGQNILAKELELTEVDDIISRLDVLFTNAIDLSDVRKTFHEHPSSTLNLPRLGSVLVLEVA